MHSDTQQGPKRMRMGELVRASGLTRETVHFYLREGLLPPPEKVNARVAYFDDSHLTRLRLIKAFQQAHVPLAKIREQLEAMSKLGFPVTAAAAERAVAVVTEFYSLDGEEPALDRAEVARGAGLTLEQLSELEELGVLRPQAVDGGPLYTAAEAEAAAAVRTILDQGVELKKLRFVRRYTDLAEQELAFLYRHLISPAMAAGRRDQVSATLANRGLRVIEAYLRRQYRRRAQLFHANVAVLSDPLAEMDATATEAS